MTNTQIPSETKKFTLERAPILGVAARFFTVVYVAAMVIGSAALFAPEARAQDDAVERETVVKELGEKYREAPVARGLASNGAMIELFTREDGASWTIILTTPDGKSRLLSAGEFWTKATKVALGEPI